MAFDFEKLLKRYVWDEEKTPYFTTADKLNRRQAHYEAVAYGIFMSVLFGVVSLASMGGAGGHAGGDGPAVFGFSFICAAVIFAVTKHYYASLWLGIAPVATVGYFLIYGFLPSWALIDKGVILGFVVLWAVYSMRIITIGRRFEDMPEPPPKT